MDSRASRITVLAVDDHLLLRAGIAAALKETDDLLLVAEAASGAEAVDLFARHRPDVTLMDIQMDGMSGIDALAEIRRGAPEARVIMLTTFAGDAHVSRALKAGASGYLLKSSLHRELEDTIRLVHAGQKYLPPRIATEVATAQRRGLSEREVEVLRLVAEGNSNKRVAARLGLAEDTIKAHMATIRAKLSAVDRTHAVTIASRRGILDTGP